MSPSPASRHPRLPTPSLPSPASPCPPPVEFPAFLQTDDMRKYLKEQIREHTKHYIKAATRENISLEIAAGLDRLRRDIAHAKEAWSTMPTESVSQGASERVQKQVGERGDALRRLGKEVGGLKSSFVHTVDDFGTSLESFRSSLDSHRSTVKTLSQTLTGHITDTKLNEEQTAQLLTRASSAAPPTTELDLIQIVHSELGKAGFEAALDNIKALLESVDEVKTCLEDDSLAAQTHYESLRVELDEVEKVVHSIASDVPAKVSEIVTGTNFRESLPTFVATKVSNIAESKKGREVLCTAVLALLKPALERIDSRIANIQLRADNQQVTLGYLIASRASMQAYLVKIEQPILSLLPAMEALAKLS